MTVECQIDAIYQAIHDLAVTFDSDITVPCWDYDEIKQAMPSGNTPIRVLSTVGEGGNAQMGYMLVANSAKVTWNIEDTLYLTPVTAGGGIRDCTADLVKYCKAYVEAVRNKRNPTAQSDVTAVSFDIGTYTWGTTEFFGVRVLLTIDEFIAGA